MRFDRVTTFYLDTSSTRKKEYISEANDLIGKIKGCGLDENDKKEVLEKIINGFQTLEIIK
jgi:hypothetical protein